MGGVGSCARTYRSSTSGRSQFTTCAVANVSSFERPRSSFARERRDGSVLSSSVSTCAMCLRPAHVRGGPRTRVVTDRLEIPRHGGDDLRLSRVDDVRTVSEATLATNGARVLLEGLGRGVVQRLE